MNGMSNQLDQQLHSAVKADERVRCIALIEDGANVNAIGEFGFTMLQWAAINGNSQICTALIEHGANVNATDAWGSTALHEAAVKGHLDTCITLMTHGANPLSESSHGQTAVDMAISLGQESCVRAMRAWLSAQAAREAMLEFGAAAPLHP